MAFAANWELNTCSMVHQISWAVLHPINYGNRLPLMVDNSHELKRLSCLWWIWWIVYSMLMIGIPLLLLYIALVSVLFQEYMVPVHILSLRFEVEISIVDNLPHLIVFLSTDFEGWLKTLIFLCCCLLCRRWCWI